MNKTLNMYIIHAYKTNKKKYITNLLNKLYIVYVS